MKTTFVRTFVIASVVGVFVVAAYALRENPAPAGPPIPSLSFHPDQANTAFHDDHLLPVSFIGGLRPDSRQTTGSVTAGIPAGAGSADNKTPALAGNEVAASAANRTAALSAKTSSSQFQPVSAPAQSQPPLTHASIIGSEPPPRSASVPLAFRPLPPAAAQANPQLAQDVQQLQQDFVNAIGGPNQDPNDPAYAQRWSTAQFASDERYRLLIGAQAYLAQQMSVSNQ
jgi:hypothetical protein